MAEKWKTPYYFPSKEADVVSWVRNFIAVLVANAARWGITEALVTALGNLGMAFEDAYNRRMLPDAGKVSTEQKNLALKVLKKGVQNMVNGHINHNEAVTPDDWVALGLYVYEPGRSPMGVPETTVVLRIVMGLVRQLVIYFTDSATPESRVKPSRCGDNRTGLRGVAFAACGHRGPPLAGVRDEIAVDHDVS
jgi:hypothetical protein